MKRLDYKHNFFKKTSIISFPWITEKILSYHLGMPVFCWDRGGIKGIPFSPTAQETLLDTFPEVIKVILLLPSASNEKDTPIKGEKSKVYTFKRSILTFLKIFPENE